MSLSELLAVITIMLNCIIIVVLSMLLRDIKRVSHVIIRNIDARIHQFSTQCEEISLSKGFVWMNGKGEEVIVKDPYLEKIKKLYNK